MNQAVNFLREAWNRIGSKSPKFFYVTKIIGATLALAGKLPWALERYTSLEPSQEFVNLCSDVGTFFMGVFFTSFLPSQSTPVAVTQDGEAVQKTDTSKMPFTAKVEEKKMENMDIPTIDNLPK